MKRRTKGVLLIGSLAVATMVGMSVAPSLALWLALTRGLDHGRCPISFRNLMIGCTFKSSRTTTARLSTHAPFEPGSVVDETSWDITNHCPLGDIARRLFCADVSVAAPARDDLDVELSAVTGLPLPRGRIVTTEMNSPLIKSVHVETPLDLAAVLGFYRAELSKRGWTENDGVVIEPDHAMIAFRTTDGPALLRLIRQDARTIADLSLRKPAAVEKADMAPNPGHAKLMLGNATDEEAVITINQRTIKLATRTERHFMDKLKNSPQIDLPPGKYKVSLKVASSAAQNREFEVGADETWALLVGPAGVPLPVHLY